VNLNSRLAKLESQQPQPAPVRVISDTVYNRSMETLAAALGDMTCQPITPSQAEQAVKGLNYE